MKPPKKVRRRKIPRAPRTGRGAGQAIAPPAGPTQRTTAPDASQGDLSIAGPIAEPLAVVMDRLTVLHQSAVARRAELETAAKVVPQTEPCRFGGLHPIDLDESSRESYGKPAFVWVYTPCRQCAGERSKPWHVRAGVPTNLAGATFENWRPELASDHEVLGACKRFAHDPARRMLVLAGKVGTGKSHLAVAVMVTVGRPARWITQNTILLKLRQTYRDDGAEDIVEACKSVRHLTIDDLGTSTGSRDEFPALYEIIAHRYNEGLSTVMTTNLPSSQWNAVFGDRLEDRLKTAAILALHGDSKR